MFLYDYENYRCVCDPVCTPRRYSDKKKYIVNDITQESDNTQHFSNLEISQDINKNPIQNRWTRDYTPKMVNILLVFIIE